MSYTTLLIDVCTIRRNTAGAVDDWGNAAESWADYLTNQPCRLNAGSGREIMVGGDIVIADYRCFVGDIDVTEKDRVVVNSVTYEVLLVSLKQHETGDDHKELNMRVVR